ncbi:winged helix-turn-helix transcriptional regulator [Pedobacter zeae]|uniref:Transcriptional regulator n=1 Tax=Pedobacter zeae TaxID=1737356 RepID=A0A7W6P7L8_9SPHI|nr:helix-turn-helix domain-containing protein [Pedobacter zeae]MBB4109089.1 DNA-binding HxlR family transcriptional regulator [Pedobacter zeae]GGH10218.1 transcriptional regulator [Pedobacter zeae]
MLEELTIQQKIKYLQDTLYVISGKWKLLILMSMYGGTCRFRELQRSVEGITTRVLSKELKELEVNKLIERKIDNTYPVLITYQLTPYSFSLKPMVDEMITWGAQHRKELSKP